MKIVDEIVLDVQLTPAECRAAARTIAVFREAMAPVRPPDGGAPLAVAQRKLVDALKGAGVHTDGDVLDEVEHNDEVQA